MRFSHMIFYVPDVLKTVEFYKKAFGFSLKYMADGEMFAELETGSTSLSFAKESLAKSTFPEGVQSPSLTSKPFANEIAFITDDLDEAFERALAAGATEVSKPKEMFWGQTVSYLRDFNGIVIELASELHR